MPLRLQNFNSYSNSIRHPKLHICSCRMYLENKNNEPFFAKLGLMNVLENNEKNDSVTPSGKWQENPAGLWRRNKHQKSLIPNKVSFDCFSITYFYSVSSCRKYWGNALTELCRPEASWNQDRPGLANWRRSDYQSGYRPKRHPVRC